MRSRKSQHYPDVPPTRLLSLTTISPHATINQKDRAQTCRVSAETTLVLGVGLLRESHGLHCHRCHLRPHLSGASKSCRGAASRQPVSSAHAGQCGTHKPSSGSQAREPRRSTTTASYRKTARNVVAMATGDAPAEVASELPEIVKTVQDAWEKVEDKYVVTSLGVAAIIALWGSTGMISAIDRLPLIPGVLELVGIGYTGWFVYRNLVFEPEREALIAKIKSTYGEIIGSS
ncbi:uncharacterized protein A4U43_C10F1550 [Asparagus officinalis]|uniref:Cyanobacterial aminoacyl-tRNA synthetase CAAD domain-containing protein n=1 Tax=Asparagus officinalis TaxID=4686 RepID=A0A5P1DZV5_ASPOF|nr:protein CURVATURE THYLAKOID 1B, chloroplastic-like [Asparagus officinalis]ONK55844.1 uncharacterized protein A4U43_C10F1550 [Asparagus officinalis]